MDNPVYKMMITNLKHYFKNQTPQEALDTPFNAFDAAEVLSVALGKHPGDIVSDLLKEQKNG